MRRSGCGRRWPDVRAEVRSQSLKGSASGIPTLSQTARKDGAPGADAEKRLREKMAGR